MTEEQLAILMVERNNRIRATYEVAEPKQKTPQRVAEEEFMAQTGSSVYIHRAKGNA
jgi:hypothetical protein